MHCVKANSGTGGHLSSLGKANLQADRIVCTNLLAIGKPLASEVTLLGLSSVYLSKVTLKLNHEE